MTASLVKMMGYYQYAPSEANSYNSTYGECRDYLYNRVLSGPTNFKWMRVTPTWSAIQPNKPQYAEGDIAAAFNFYNTDPTAQSHFTRLDNVIAACNADGIFVNLCLGQYFPTAWTYPGSPAIEPNSDVGDGKGKPASQRLPQNVAAGSYWSQLVTYIYNRYHGTLASGGVFNDKGPGSSYGYLGNPRKAWIGAFEFCNEPNYYAWNNSGDFNDSTVAKMFMTVDGILNFWGAACGVLGPALSDTPAVNYPPPNGGVDRIDSKTFADRVLGGLVNWRPTNYVAWSHHNYRDMNSTSGGTLDISRVNAIAALLSSKNWRGGGDRNIWVTEGGYVLDEMYSDVDKQKTAISKTWDAYKNHANVVTFPQYQLNNLVGKNYFRSGFTTSGMYDPTTGNFIPGTRLGSAATFRDLT